MRVEFVTEWDANISGSLLCWTSGFGILDGFRAAAISRFGIIYLSKVAFADFSFWNGRICCFFKIVVYDCNCKLFGMFIGEIKQFNIDEKIHCENNL